MKIRLSISIMSLLMVTPCLIAQEGPLPKFTTPKVILDPTALKWAPGADIEHPGFIKVEGRVEQPLGKYYLYYAPHKHHGIGLAYADDPAGPWTEYAGNPVLDGPAAPDIRWIPEKNQFYLWGHTKNSRTELWTSDDGIHFEHKGVSIDGSQIGTKNASYTRVYEYPLEQYDSKYIMLYTGLEQDKNLRSIWLAHSTDAEQWTQLKEPLVSPLESEGEMRDIHGASLLQWKGRNYLIYSDNAVWHGGRLRYVELDDALSPLGLTGKRRTLIDPPEELQGRLRGTVFHQEGNTLHLISGGGKKPGLAVHATAEVE